ncbi:MAG TPA: hypothetical protein VHX90_01170 [Verrucomicrobiae bacterium]|nr:hypothetical protein [Verrucomicrobiae bacterium]
MSKAKLDLDFYQVQAGAADYAEREQMDNAALAKEAHEAEMLAAGARLHLWMRVSRQFQKN